ncbi:hypothetical protein [Coleofasciculus sp.]|uniref:hypothetical protein n=1 Tax=Coleofasciculus sp. TaxID=3100458 RepID=UPI003A2C9E70
MSSIVLKDLNFIERAVSEPSKLTGGRIIALPGLLSRPIVLNLNLEGLPSSSGVGSSDSETSSSATAQISGDQGGTTETFALTRSNKF